MDNLQGNNYLLLYHLREAPQIVLGAIIPTEKLTERRTATKEYLLGKVNTYQAQGMMNNDGIISSTISNFKRNIL